LIGRGCYADNRSAAASTTGWGEPIMKLVLAKWAADRVASGNAREWVAAEAVDCLKTRLDGHGGMTLLDRRGRCGIGQHTPRTASSNSREGVSVTLLIRLRIVCLSLLLAAGLGCGGGSFSPSPQALPTAAPPPSASALSVPVFLHVFVVVEENHGYSSVIGSSSMPYLNSLASKYGLATQYYANTHPSIGNYFMMTTGRLITNNDSYSTTVTVDNLARRFLT